MVEELIAKNVAGLGKVQSARKTQRRPWFVEGPGSSSKRHERRWTRCIRAYMLILVLGFRRGEVLGLTWKHVDLDAGEVTVQLQLQRVRRQLVHGDTKTNASAATLPLP